MTERAGRLERDSFPTAFKRWFKSLGTEAVPHQPVPGRPAAAPIIMAAVDLSEGMQALGEELRAHVGRVLAALPGVRLACVNVLKLNRLTMNYALDEEGRNIHVQRLVELKDWARPLGLAQEHITFHVLEHADPAAALVEYAKLNHVDQIFIGARANSTHQAPARQRFIACGRGGSLHGDGRAGRAGGSGGKARQPAAR